MPFLITLLVIALIVAFLFLSTLFIVPQQQAYIIERFGKFNKVAVRRHSYSNPVRGPYRHENQHARQSA